MCDIGWTSGITVGVGVVPGGTFREALEEVNRLSNGGLFPLGSLSLVGRWIGSLFGWDVRTSGASDSWNRPRLSQLISEAYNLKVVSFSSRVSRFRLEFLEDFRDCVGSHESPRRRWIQGAFGVVSFRNQ